MKDKIKEKLLKGCGNIFGDSYYKDMNPRPCGTKKGDVIFLCSDCRKLLNQHKETKKAERERFEDLIESILLRLNNKAFESKLTNGVVKTILLYKDVNEELKKELEKNEI